jgi:hypothetical protein
LAKIANLKSDARDDVMYGRVKGDKFNVSSKSSIAACVIGGIAGLVLYKLHLEQKWDAAFVGALAPIWYLAGVFRSRWNHMSFWTSFIGCLLAHLGFIWFVFGTLLRNTDTVGILVWIPAGMVECVGLYYLIDILDRKLGNDLQ